MTVPQIGIIILVVLPMLAIWLFVLVDAIRREDLTAGRKIFWVLAALIVPLVAILVYLLARPRRSSAAGTEVPPAGLRRRRPRAEAPPESAWRAAGEPGARLVAQHGSMADTADGSRPRSSNAAPSSRRRRRGAGRHTAQATGLDHPRSAAARRSRRAGHHRPRPGPPAMSVVVEVRSRRPEFGPQEERLDEAKVRRLYRAMNVLRSGRRSVRRPARRRWRVDLVAIDEGSAAMRHLKGLIPR